MTENGRLIRGKANLEAGKFLKNQETLDYIESIKVVDKPKENKKYAKR